jgi:hypothetical protein
MQPDGTLNDDALDRELERALAVDPSPEFVARVRTRIANEPARSPWRASWMFALGVVAMVMVTAIVVQRTSPSIDSGQAGGAATVANTPLLTARTIAPYVASGFGRTSPDPDRSARAVALYRDARGSTGSPRGVLTPARPELDDQPPRFALRRSAVASAKAEGRVLIDPRESVALRALISGVRSGRVDLGPVLSASVPVAMDPPPIDDIVISPIEIEPLAPPTGAEGVRQ